jgi:anaerobic selenocysteine-containing dehydrogenase
MVIVGAALNHWYHMDMNYRGIINMLMMCGCIGQSGGGWAHYVGQENCVRKPAGRRWPSRWTGPPAAPDERHQLLLRPHQPVAPRKAGHRRNPRQRPAARST